MNRKSLTVGIALVLGSLTMALAQDTPKPPTAPVAPAAPTIGMPGAPGAPGSRPMTVMRDRTDMLARMLNLSDEQKEKVRPILDEEQKKMQEIREQTQTKLKPILTQEQWDKYYRPTPGAGRMPGMVPPGAPVNPAPATPAPPSK
jgi:Spy/CpxP family protein refolding chaperone